MHHLPSIPHPQRSDGASPGWGYPFAHSAGRHLFVSNRSPFVYRESDADFDTVKAIGGLVSTMEPAFRKLGGVWIGSCGDGDTAIRLVSGTASVPQCFSKPVNLTDEELQLYYNGFANGALWPLCHSMPEKFSFNMREWYAYERVNEKFARKITEELETVDDTVWVHDYHLAMTPYYVRNWRPGVRIACFWHIPFPPPQIFSLIPNCKEILRGLLHSQCIGFHCNSYVDNFLRAVETELADAAVDFSERAIRLGGLKTRIRAIPLGIDFNFWEREAQSRESSLLVDQIRADMNVEHLALSVDRLDYTKGILERIGAIEALFEIYPRLIGYFSLLQIGVPTRTSVAEYRQYQQAIDHEIARVNNRFGSGNWMPIVHEKGMTSQKRLAGLYRAADIACVTPLRDGMNLVAKEFVASRIDLNGALVLSRFAGVAEEFGDDAVLVDPLARNDMARKIESALVLSRNERRARMKQMRRKVRNKDLFWWLDSISAQIMPAHMSRG